MVYIKEYTELNPKEKRQLFYKRKFKSAHPEWDDSMVLLTQLADKHIDRDTMVLDAGCGNGNFVIDELRGKFKKVVGVDVSPEVTARNKTADEIVFANLNNLSFKNDSFDAVVSLWVLEHVEDPTTVFKEIARVLRPGGTFVFVTPNKHNVLIRLRRLLSHHTAEKLVWKLYGRAHEDTFDVFYRANTLREAERLAKENGFAVEYCAENFDPSYTSFGPVSYFLTKLTYYLPLSFFKTHLVAILRKNDL